ncbi:DUF2865 domain-containing protein [Methylocella sp.]|uniref:DUF2865 domain-containing protein n=1 Tax=Methylocella sp. TaxID=1978226 RepID=UPI0037834F2D
MSESARPRSPASRRPKWGPRRSFRFPALLLLALAPATQGALAQGYDCSGLQAKIAELDRGGGAARGPGPSREQLGELNRLIAVARSMSCDQAPYAYGGRCPGLNAQIRQLQDQVGQARSRGDASDRAAARVELVARFNTYCRNQPPRQRGFFEQLFGIPSAPESPPQPDQAVPAEDAPRQEEADGRPRGGSQAVCVRTCDGGFFPLGVSARGADAGQLTSLCQSLCPNASVEVFTRNPDRTIETAVSLEGAPYSEMPNAGKFEKTFDPACSCKAPGQSWVDALAGAEAARQSRKGDILVTPEKSAELSAPKAAPASPAPGAQGRTAAPPPEGDAQTREVVGPDGVKRRVRVVAPTL